jgi:hypothetical protein
MPRASTLLSTFNAGEWSPDLFGRVDLQKYDNSCRLVQNFILTAQGPALRRPGTRFVAAAKTNGPIRLIPFEFSTEQAYVIEAGANYFRFFKDRGRIEQPAGAPVELSTPYTAAELPGLKWAQSADVLYLCHPNHQPQKLSRLSHTSWTLTPFEGKDGPYLEENSGGITLAPSATTGSGITITAAPGGKAVTGAVGSNGRIRLTVSGHGLQTGDPIIVANVGGTVEANGSWTVTRVSASVIELQGSAFSNAYTSGGTITANLFAPTDIGRLVRVKHSSQWGWARITDVNGPAKVTADVQSDFGGTTAVASWRLGAWSDTTGWPSCVTFYEERLFFANTRHQPQTLWGSGSGAYESFAPSQSDGTVNDDHALDFTISDDRLNAVRWMSAGKSLIVGAVGAEFNVAASNLNEALTPTNIAVRRETTVGSADIQAIRVSQAVLYVQRAQRKIYEMAYDFQTDGFASPEMSLLARHLVRDGIREIAYQQEPWSVLWTITEAGKLVGFTYLRAEDVVGWHQHPWSGPDDKARSLAVIAGTSQDELWLAVERSVDGEPRVYVEYMEYSFESAGPEDNESAFFVDCGLSYDGNAAPELTIAGSATTIGATLSLSLDADQFEPGDIGREIHHRYRNATTGSRQTAKAVILSVADPRHATARVTAPFPPLATIAGGGWAFSATSIGGLDHLEGRTVAVLADGATHPDRIVIDGTIDLDRPASRVQIGLPFISRLVSVDIDAGAADGTAQGKARRIHRVVVRLINSLGCKIGADEGPLETLILRDGSMPMDQAPRLFTGDQTVVFPKGWGRAARIAVLQDSPLPCSVVALVAQLSTMDG